MRPSKITNSQINRSTVQIKQQPDISSADNVQSGTESNARISSNTVLEMTNDGATIERTNPFSHLPPDDTMGHLVLYLELMTPKNGAALSAREEHDINQAFSEWKALDEKHRSPAHTLTNDGGIPLDPVTNLYGEMCRIDWVKCTRNQRRRKLRVFVKRGFEMGFEEEILCNLFDHLLTPLKLGGYYLFVRDFIDSLKAADHRRIARQKKASQSAEIYNPI